MEYNQRIGILFLIIGLIFIIFPIFSLSLVSIFVGLAVFLPSLGLLIAGLSRRGSLESISIANIIVGIIGIIIGLVFIFNVGALSFLTALEFYIMGFILIFLAITGYFGELRVIKGLSAVIMGIFGIILIIVGIFAANPVYLAMIIGICFIIQGVQTYLE